MKQTVNARKIVLDLLIEVDKEEGFATKLLQGALAKVDYLPRNEKAFIKRLFEGCVERRIYLEHIIKRYLKTPISKVKKTVRLILRMGVFQLLYMDSVPDSAACDEAVKLCRQMHFDAQSGFVNGVLRNIARDKERLSCEQYTDLAEYRNGKGLAEAASIFYSMPLFLVQKYEKRFGKERTLQILEGYYKESGITLRMCSGKPADDAWISEVEKLGITVTSHPYLPYAYILKGAAGAGQLPGFDRGLFYIQDVSSMLVCELAGITEGMKVIDVCSSPGGKGLHAYDLGAKVSARDVSIEKVDRLCENAGRLGVSGDRYETLVQDARLFRIEDEGSADVVIADVPCSGYGIIGKKCDIKYGISPEKEESLTHLQREILDSAARYVKLGGILMYSTCTINYAENEEQMKYLMELGFEPQSVEEKLPDALRGLTGKDGYIQLLPGVHECDGFFIAKLRRKVE